MEARKDKVAKAKTVHDDGQSLPIDAYRDEILQRINRNAVTIIVGETGCGKSSRLPIMLLEDAKSKGLENECRMMVSQPRRIAVTNLYRRVKESLGDKVAMKMGHGVREESEDSQIYFVTSGLLVRLLAYNPGMFSRHSHIVIDEVHERSVDGDVVCLLVKRLLCTFPHIKVILMSATIHADIYFDYFSFDDRGNCSTEDKTLFVGTRRYPLEINYLDSLCKCNRKDICSLARKLMESCEQGKRIIKSDNILRDQYRLAVFVVTSFVPRGTSVLIFVSGMKDITELTEKFSAALPHDPIVVIHSEVPFEEQEEAFLPCKQGEIKIILATNAAESSITLPDIDTVICLGMHKTMKYDSKHHREMLVNDWISKASATQQAGRTGRVRPGRVFRLYSMALFENVMEAFSQPEILRVPLQETILTLRVMLEGSVGFEGVIPLLRDLIQPPDMDNVESSFEHLFVNGMIDEPSDYGALTESGRFVGSLPVGIFLGRLITFAVLLGVMDEGVMLAAAVSLPKSPYRIASKFVHSDAEYNSIVNQIFLSSCYFDNGAYSEPLMLINLLMNWRNMSSKSKEFQKEQWIKRHCIAKFRLKHLDSYARNLSHQVRTSLKMNAKDDGKISYNASNVTTRATADKNDVGEHVFLNKATLNKLRLVLLWTYSEDHVMKLSKVKNLTLNPYQMRLTNHYLLTQSQLETIFPPSSVPFALRTIRQTMYSVDAKSNVIVSRHDCKSPMLKILEEFMAIIPKEEVEVIWVQFNEGRKSTSAYAFSLTTPRLFSENFNEYPCIWKGSTRYRVFSGDISASSRSEKSLQKLAKNEFNLFNESIHILLTANQNVEVLCKGVELSPSELNELFRGDTAKDVSITTKQSNNPYQCVEFLPEKVKSHTRQENSNLVRVKRKSDLIDDIPLGLRLYRAYMSGIMRLFGL